MDIIPYFILIFFRVTNYGLKVLIHDIKNKIKIKRGGVEISVIRGLLLYISN